MRRKFESRTDHNGLKYSFEQQTLNVRKTRWLEFMSEYDFDIKHIKGKENKISDTLNIRVHAMHATIFSMCKSYLKNKNLEVVVSYGRYLQAKEELLQGNVQQKYKEYKLGKYGILMHKNKVCVPNSQELMKPIF